MEKRMNTPEQKAAIELLGVVDMLAEVEEKWQHRIEIVPGAKKNLRTAKGFAKRVYLDAMKTVPVDQQKHIRAQLPFIRVNVGIKKPSVTDKRLEENGVWLSYVNLKVLADAARERCLVCQKDVQQQRQCELAKVLDLTAADGLPEHVRGCKYFGL